MRAPLRSPGSAPACLRGSAIVHAPARAPWYQADRAGTSASGLESPRPAHVQGNRKRGGAELIPDFASLHLGYKLISASLDGVRIGGRQTRSRALFLQPRTPAVLERTERNK